MLKINKVLTVLLEKNVLNLFHFELRIVNYKSFKIFTKNIDTSFVYKAL